MKQAKRILVPTDFSENSRAGLRFGLSLAAENGADLLILHVGSEFRAWEVCDEATFFSPRVTIWEADRVVREDTLDLNQFLEGHREELCRIPTVRKRVVLGEVVDKIIDIAEEEQVDLIVMSPRPHGAIRRFFLGSITDRVTREAPCPVLSVSVPRQARRWKGKLVPSALPPLCHEKAST
jgi:nucleotide-binding universal stress UspA family protein